MQFKDYYRILGVSSGATADEIKRAYRKLARKYHPDVNKESDAQKRFTELGEANEALKDPERRAAYDALRAAGWKEGQEMEIPPPSSRTAQSTTSAEDANPDFSDFFQSFFGRAQSHGFGRTAYADRGDDIHAAFAVTLDEAYAGGERQLTLKSPTRGDDGAWKQTERTITVKIPKGVATGSHLRLRGQGRPGATVDQNGDLYLEIELAPHRLFQVDGRDVTLEVPLAPWEAVLGAQVAVPSLAGKVMATIPAGAQPLQKLRLKGLGLPGDPAGDQYLVLSIASPATVSDNAKELYRKLAQEAPFNPRARLGA